MNERDNSQKGGVDIRVLKGNEFQSKGENISKDTTFHLTPRDLGIHLYGENDSRFDQQSIASPRGPVIGVRATENNAVVNGIHGNGGSILQKVVWKAKHYHPTDHQFKVKKGDHNRWSINVGQNPHLPSTITLEDDHPALEITFAGHVDTLVRTIIEEYPDNHDLRTFAISFATSQSLRAEDDISLWRTICSPSHISGEFSHAEYDTQTNSRHPFSYTGNGLVYAEVHKSTKRKKDLPFSSIRLSIATVADADQKLRIYHTRWQDLAWDGRHKRTKTEKTALCMHYAHILELVGQNAEMNEALPLDSFEFLDIPIDDEPDAHEFMQSQDRFKTILKVLPNPKKSKRK